MGARNEQVPGPRKRRERPRAPRRPPLSGQDEAAAPQRGSDCSRKFLTEILIGPKLQVPRSGTQSKSVRRDESSARVEEHPRRVCFFRRRERSTKPEVGTDSFRGSTFRCSPGSLLSRFRGPPPVCIALANKCTTKFPGPSELSLGGPIAVRPDAASEFRHGLPQRG